MATDVHNHIPLDDDLHTAILDRLLQCLPDVMAGCAGIERFSFGSDDTLVFTNGRPALYPLLDLYDNQDVLHTCARLSALNVAVDNVYFNWSNTADYGRCIRFVADHFGPKLKKYAGHFKEDDDALNYLLSRCPNLLNLELVF